MRKVSDIYGSAYLRAADVGDQTHRLSIENIAVEEVGEDRDEKLVIYFAGAKKAMVLNATNANELAAKFGDDPTDWPGHTVEVFTIPTTYAGKPCRGLRVRPIVEQASPLMTNSPAAPIGVPAAQTTRALEHAHVNGLDDAPF